MFVIIELKDHVDKTHDSFKCTLPPDAMIADLQNSIKASFRIEVIFQRITDNAGRRIDLIAGTKTVEAAEIKSDETLTVKHALLENWSEYLSEIEEIRKNSTEGATSWRKEIALRSRTQIDVLDDSTFFAVYTEFAGIRREIDREINCLIFNTKKYMRRAVYGYFNLFFGANEVELIDKPKNFDGVRLGFIVVVKVEQKEHLYYAKTAGCMPKMEFPIELKPTVDLAEIFVYQFLKLIDVGSSDVHIISDSDGIGSDCVYLATKLIDGFLSANGNSIEQALGRASSTATGSEMIMSVEMNKQLNILVGLFGLEDLLENKGNYGFVKNKVNNAIQELRIVDFRVNVSRLPRISKSKADIPYIQRCFNKWDIATNIDKAKELVEEDKAIKDNPNTNKSIFNTYIQNIKQVLQDFVKNPRKSDAS